MTQAMSGMAAGGAPQSEVDKAISQIDFGATPRDMIAVKIEKQMMFAEGKVYHRDDAKIWQSLQDEVKNYRSFCMDAKYKVPVGKDDARGGEQKLASGLSIRAAEAIYCALGANSVERDIIPITNVQYKLIVRYTDYAKLQSRVMASIISKEYMGWVYDEKGKKTNRKEIKTIPDDRFFHVMVPGAFSRLEREAILRSTSPGMRGELELLIDDALDKYLDDDTVTKIMDKFAAKGVGVEQLEKEIGRHRNNWAVADRKDLLGLWNALHQGDIDADTIGAGVALATQEQGEKTTAAPKSSTADLKANIRENMNKVDTAKFMEISKSHGFYSLEAIGNSEDPEKLKALNSALAEALAIQITETNKAKKETKVAEVETPKGKPIAEAPDGGTAAADQTGADEVCSKALMGEIKRAAQALPDDKKHQVFENFKIKGLLPVEKWAAKDARDLLAALEDAK